jgi:chromosome segregation protein
LQWQSLDIKARDMEAKVSSQEVKLEAEIATQRTMEAGIERHREDNVEANDAFNEIQAQFYQVGSDRRQLESDFEQADAGYQEMLSHQKMDQESLAELEMRRHAGLAERVG